MQQLEQQHSQLQQLQQLGWQPGALLEKSAALYLFFELCVPSYVYSVK
jgi:hypothetical protein